MRTIHKYPLRITNEQRFIIPTGAVPRHLGIDYIGQLCLWMEVESDNSGAGLPVYIFGTGHPIPDDLPAEFFGTAVINGLVWHVFLGEQR